MREITFNNAEEITEEGLPLMIMFHKKGRMRCLFVCFLSFPRGHKEPRELPTSCPAMAFLPERKNQRRHCYLRTGSFSLMKNNNKRLVHASTVSFGQERQRLSSHCYWQFLAHVRFQEELRGNRPSSTLAHFCQRLALWQASSWIPPRPWSRYSQMLY